MCLPNSQIPEEFFIFVNEHIPLTYHNFNVIKSFVSSGFMTAGLGPVFLEKYLNGTIDYLPYNYNPDFRLAVSPFCMRTINEYRVEVDAEIIRKEFFPLYPSRLSATYAFGDYSTCVAISKKYTWDLKTVRRFKLVDHPLNRVVKVNMEIVSLLRHAYYVSMMSQSDIDDLWKSYWSGGESIQMELPSTDFQRQRFESGVIWEYLIEGQLVVID